MMAVLSSVGWHLAVILVCISLIISDAGIFSCACWPPACLSSSSWERRRRCLGAPDSAGQKVSSFLLPTVSSHRTGHFSGRSEARKSASCLLCPHIPPRRHPSPILLEPGAGSAERPRGAGSHPDRRTVRHEQGEAEGPASSPIPGVPGAALPRGGEASGSPGAGAP